MAAVTQVIRETGATGNEVVLGEDWVRPQSAVDTEVRIRRARRGILSIFRSPLARKIILFNMLALVLLVAGVLFTNPFRDTLARQHQTALIAQAEGLADLMAVLPEIGGTDGYGDDQARALRARALARLTLTAETEVLLIAADGTIEAA